MKVKILSLTVFLFLVLFVGCTENLFFSDDENAQDNYSITGKVLLSDGTEPDDIYIWVADLNISTWTNENGDFTLSIPKTDEFAGLNGEFTVYFYIANYKFTTVQVFIRNGEFVFGEKDISSAGKIKEIKTLQKLLHITTTIKPNTHSPDYTGLFTFIIVVNAIDKPVTIVTNQTKEGIFGSFVLEHDDEPLSEAILLNIGPLYTTADEIARTTIWETGLVIDYNSLKLGYYSGRPYIEIRQNGLPSELIASFGYRINEFSHNYLKIPCKQEVARIEVR